MNTTALVAPTTAKTAYIDGRGGQDCVELQERLGAGWIAQCAQRVHDVELREPLVQVAVGRLGRCGEPRLEQRLGDRGPPCTQEGA